MARALAAGALPRVVAPFWALLLRAPRDLAPRACGDRGGQSPASVPAQRREPLHVARVRHERGPLQRGARGGLRSPAVADRAVRAAPVARARASAPPPARAARAAAAAAKAAPARSDERPSARRRRSAPQDAVRSGSSAASSTRADSRDVGRRAAPRGTRAGPGRSGCRAAKPPSDQRRRGEGRGRAGPPRCAHHPGCRQRHPCASARRALPASGRAAARPPVSRPFLPRKVSKRTGGAGRASHAQKRVVANRRSPRTRLRLDALAESARGSSAAARHWQRYGTCTTDRTKCTARVTRSLRLPDS